MNAPYKKINILGNKGVLKIDTVNNRNQPDVITVRCIAYNTVIKEKLIWW